MENSLEVLSDKELNNILKLSKVLMQQPSISEIQQVIVYITVISVLLLKYLTYIFYAILNFSYKTISTNNKYKITKCRISFND